jgi:hypothetical protein
MKKQEWTAGLDHIDSALVEQYVQQKETLTQKKKKRNFWLRAGAMAACLALVLGAAVVGAVLRGNTPGVNPNPDNRPNIPILNVQTPSSAPMYYGSEFTNGKSGSSAELRDTGLSVTARLLETLPDTYTFFDDWEQFEYRLLRMKTVKLIKGQETVDEFYYLVPAAYMTDFSIFDCFVIKDMAQFTYEYSIVYNKTQEKAEQLSLVIFGYGTYGYTLMGEKLMAFDKAGYFDERLWKTTEVWREATKHSQVVGNIKEAIKKIQNEANPWDDRIYVHLLKDISEEAAQVLSQMKTFENGLYVQNFSNTIHLGSGGQLKTTRYVNGFATNEMISIYMDGDTDKLIFTKARFDEQDLAALPDLRSAFTSLTQTLESGTILPPNFSAQVEIKRTTTGIFGWYAKTENGVIGIMRVSWCCYTEKYQSYYDDAYFIVEYGSLECKQISRDDLLEMLGEYEKQYIYTGKYYEYGKDLRYQAEY